MTTCDLHALAFLLINGSRLPIPPGTLGVAGRRVTAAEADEYLADRLTRIAAIARLTGLDFFGELAPQPKERLEWRRPSHLWPSH